MPRSRVSKSWNDLLHIAIAEVRDLVAALPSDLRPQAEALPVVFEPQPRQALLDEGWPDDLLGLFEGDSIDVPASERSPIPTRISLFLENLWDYSEDDEEIYREEIRITYLHELGHYLGLDEGELEERDLL